MGDFASEENRLEFVVRQQIPTVTSTVTSVEVL